MGTMRYDNVYLKIGKGSKTLYTNNLKEGLVSCTYLDSFRVLFLFCFIGMLYKYIHTFKQFQHYILS